MALLDYITAPQQRTAYLFPERAVASYTENGQRGWSDQTFRQTQTSVLRDVFVFQFWPQQVTDTYTPNYAQKQIPGGSHPIYQWTSGSGRELSFTANFVTELSDENHERDQPGSTPTAAPSSLPGYAPYILPSARYTVNVAAAIAALQRYLYPSYNGGIGSVRAPNKLILVLPGVRLGRDDGDGILCILRSANVTMESFFPHGELRAASVALRFSEIVQHTGDSGDVSQIRYIGSASYSYLAANYLIDKASEKTINTRLSGA